MTIILLLKAKAYVPPHLRNANNSAKFKTKLHEDDEKPDKNLKIKPTKSEAEELEKKIKTVKKVIIGFDIIIQFFSKLKSNI